MPIDAKLARIVGPVEEDLARMRAVLEEELTAESPAVADMVAHISRFRGKQLRGALVLLVGTAAGRRGGEDLDEHPRVAAIVELIHLATLVHDDVLDGAKVRRRVACVNERWDNQVAVLLGDMLYARAFDLSTRLRSRLASRVLSESTQRICVGEIDQAAARYDFDMSQERYEAIAGAKTAELYAAACELGARYPDAPEEIGLELRAFGWEVGLAFQIIDDCLDVVGDEEVVGKSVGNDVEDGKVTLPILHVYQSADEVMRNAIRDVYSTPGLERRAERLREVTDLTPGVDHALARAHELVRTARERLTHLETGPAREALETFCDFVLERRF